MSERSPAPPIGDGATTRRFDGERWWAWDGGAWVLVPDWDAPGADADPTVSVASTATEQVASATSATARRGTTVALLALALVVVAAIAGVVVASMKQNESPATNYHDMKVLAAELVRSGNEAAKQQGLDRTITKAECLAGATPDARFCTLTLSTSELFMVDVAVTPDGSAYSTIIRPQK
jgi:hypothetical protein